MLFIPRAKQITAHSLTTELIPWMGGSYWLRRGSGFINVAINDAGLITAFIVSISTQERDSNVIRNLARKIKKGLQAAPNPSENRCDYFIFSAAGLTSSTFTSVCFALTA